MLPYQPRVIVELEEISGRIERLRAFITGDTPFRSLPEVERRLLARQLIAMEAYRGALA